MYVLCFARPRYQVSVYRTIGPLVYCLFQTPQPTHTPAVNSNTKTMDNDNDGDGWGDDDDDDWGSLEDTSPAHKVWKTT